MSGDGIEDRHYEELNVGRRFDSSVGRGDFKTKIGVGRVIQGKRRNHCDCWNSSSNLTSVLRLG